MPYDTRSEIYSRYNNNDYVSDHNRQDDSGGYYVDGVWYADVPQGPARLKPYHMKGRILTYLSFLLGLATIIMILVAFVGPVTSRDSANITFLCLVTGFLGLFFGLVGKIRGRKELDLPRWPSSFGMMLGLFGCGIAAMIVFASVQNYMNYGDMIAEMEAEKDNEAVVSYGTEDGGTRDATEAEEKALEKQAQAES